MLRFARVHNIPLFLYNNVKIRKNLAAILCLIFSYSLYISQWNGFADHTKSSERKWKFSHDYENCDSLPKYDPTKTYLHRSYKTPYESNWTSLYVYFHQSWLDLHPNWEPIFWTDEQNELLFFCHPEKRYYKEFLKMTHKIKRVDFSKIMYMYIYGGMYIDFDYLALESHEPLINSYPHIDLFLQQQNQGILGFEWVFSRKPKHPFIEFLLNNISAKGTAFESGGPHKVNKTFSYFYETDEISTMADLGHRTMIVGKELISPISHRPLSQGSPVYPCAYMLWKWDKPMGRYGNGWSKEAFEETDCYRELKEKKFIALQSYMTSWQTFYREKTPDDGVDIDDKFFTLGNEQSG